MTAIRTNLIFYVRDQTASTRFYRQVLGVDPVLDVPGMTEFALNAGTVLGLMPEAGAKRLLDVDVEPKSGTVARAELYLLVDDPAAYHSRALAAGSVELSPLQSRDWGEDAAYSQDPDGHVLAFARRSA